MIQYVFLERKKWRLLRNLYYLFRSSILQNVVDIRSECRFTKLAYLVLRACSSIGYAAIFIVLRARRVIELNDSKFKGLRSIIA